MFYSKMRKSNFWIDENKSQWYFDFVEAKLKRCLNLNIKNEIRADTKPKKSLKTEAWKSLAQTKFKSIPSDVWLEKPQINTHTNQDNAHKHLPKIPKNKEVKSELKTTKDTQTEWSIQNLVKLETKSTLRKRDMKQAIKEEW